MWPLGCAELSDKALVHFIIAMAITCACLCVCVCVCQREREKEKERERDSKREREINDIEAGIYSDKVLFPITAV